MALSSISFTASSRSSTAGVRAGQELPARVADATVAFLKTMGLSADVVCRDQRSEDSPCLWVEVLSPDCRCLIGEQGSVLQAFEHVLRLVLRPLVDPSVRILADVNAYRARRAEMIRRRARLAARRARETGRAVVLEPMSPADRRVVHVTLLTEEGVRTESQGEHPDRRVVVRPADPLV